MKWAALIPLEQLPQILRERHTDWGIKYLRWVPRRWTAWVGGYPIRIFGNAPEVLFTGPSYSIFCPKPIPDPGQWWIGSPPYFSIQTRSRLHIRFGFRWDNNGNYWTLSFTIKRFK